MRNSVYWEKRVLKNEEKAQRYAAQASKRQQRLYQQTYKQICEWIDDLMIELLESGNYGNITRTELWQYKKYIDLQNVLNNVMDDVAAQQVNINEETLRQIFEDTIGATLEEIGVPNNVGFNLVNEAQANQVLNTAWSGKHYSQLVYGTNSKIAERIKRDITDMVIQGKNTTAIKKGLMNDLNVCYSYADRLVRTEASHVYNEAAKAAYKEAKVEKIRVLVENDACPICKKYKQTYLLGQEPRLPAHPNCRCCYAPVIDLGGKKND